MVARRGAKLLRRYFVVIAPYGRYAFTTRALRYGPTVLCVGIVVGKQEAKSDASYDKSRPHLFKDGDRRNCHKSTIDLEICIGAVIITNCRGEETDGKIVWNRSANVH